MNIDLSDSGFDTLNLAAYFAIGPERAETLLTLAGANPSDGPITDWQFGGYRKSNVSYSVTWKLFFDGDNLARLHVTYRRWQYNLTQDLRTSFTTLARFLDGLQLIGDVHCTSVGQFDARRFRPLIELPLMRFPHSANYFNEIRGIRLTRTSDGFDLESVTLDFQSPNSLSVEAKMWIRDGMSSQIGSSALKAIHALRDRAIERIP